MPSHTGSLHSSTQELARKRVTVLASDSYEYETASGADSLYTMGSPGARHQFLFPKRMNCLNLGSLEVMKAELVHHKQFVSLQAGPSTICIVCHRCHSILLSSRLGLIYVLRFDFIPVLSWFCARFVPASSWMKPNVIARAAHALFFALPGRGQVSAPTGPLSKSVTPTPEQPSRALTSEPKKAAGWCVVSSIGRLGAYPDAVLTALLHSVVRCTCELKPQCPSAQGSLSLFVIGMQCRQ